MLVLLPETLPITPIQGPVSPLNAVWRGEPHRRVALPQLGHLMLIFPLGDTAVSCSGITVNPGRYVWLAPAPDHRPVTVDTLEPGADRALLLVLWLSPPFIVEMAQFLGIPDNLHQLLHGVPLLQGDQMSAVAAELAAACRPPLTLEITEDLFLEVVGEVLRLMRLRHQALERLAGHKHATVADLLPRLLQARQFVEARYTQDFKTQEVADYVGLSEFHFARLFRTAFDVTLRQYVIRLRLDEARRLLEQPAATVTETAFAVGYGSLSSFIHAFGRRFGRSPAQYQAQVKSAQDLTSSRGDDAL